MKKAFLLAALAAASVLSTGAMAKSYIDLSVGASNVNVDCTGTTSCSTSGTAFKAMYGYAMPSGLAFEGGYIDFGKATASDTTVSADAKAGGVALGLAYAMPMDAKWGADFRVGIVDMKTKVTGIIPGYGSGSVSETHVKPYVGLGLSYKMNSSAKIVVGLDLTQGEIGGQSYDLRALTVGTRFGF